MAILATNKQVPLGRMLFVPKQNYRLEQLEVEASGPYRLNEKEDCFVIQNMDCCKAILVTVKAKDKA
ncbi:hypothetical protein HX99_01785 [Peptococcaceae bacterium SCADC1_2_3]|jgi:hypothetical protein|nr:hypothetical protein DK28_0203375 [Peptococcaceae bacterium SCADC1_2_3]KFI35839.1 hypothetical protein HY00_00795 [Peptococcaceae bacterium SCADC1_2_3]KFI36740.1 hypothetical protein HX99_01785 [Peptococcaceae bacterium SCADC1_2_3]KFI37487.1 hypothetical protein HY02_06340 [Peptococcaceae bacterium SCADC1_2_3]HBQ28647.1 hypothetical protein [Desulfotomaculum sp.]